MIRPRAVVEIAAAAAEAQPEFDDHNLDYYVGLFFFGIIIGLAEILWRDARGRFWLLAASERALAILSVLFFAYIVLAVLLVLSILTAIFLIPTLIFMGKMAEAGGS